MAVKPEDLNNPERDLDTTTRDPRGSKRVAADLQRMKNNDAPSSAEEELQTLRQRIATVRATVPVDPRPHCSDCFSRGWDAALKAITEE